MDVALGSEFERRLFEGPDENELAEHRGGRRESAASQSPVVEIGPRSLGERLAREVIRGWQKLDPITTQSRNITRIVATLDPYLGDATEEPACPVHTPITSVSGPNLAE